MAGKKAAKKTPTKSAKIRGLTAAEKAALKETIADQKAAARGLDGESALLAKIAAMKEPDRGMAKRIHAIVRANAPSLSSTTWYGMPAYANKAGKAVFFFQDAAKFKARYATLGFNDSASLDEGEVWPIAFALKELTPAAEAKIAALVKDESPDVKLQVAVAARKIDGLDPIPTLLAVLNNCGDDKLIPQIVWQNLHPLLEDHADAFVKRLEKTELAKAPNLAKLMPRVVERVLGRKQLDATLIVSLFGVLMDAKDLAPSVPRQCLSTLAGKLQTGEVAGANADELREKFRPMLGKVLDGKKDGPLYLDAAVLAATLKDPAGLDVVRKAALASDKPEGDRLKALDALVAAKDAAALDAAAAALADAKCSGRWAGRRSRASPPSCSTPTRSWSRTSNRGRSNC